MKTSLLAAALLCASSTVFASGLDGHVVDAATGKPVLDALVTVGTTVVKGDALGRFQIAGGENPGLKVLARAPGYRAGSFTAGDVAKSPLALTPFTPHALYLSVYGVASKPIREAALGIIQHGGANALVVDIKSDRGLLTYPSDIPLAKTIGARKLTLTHSLSDLVNNGHGQGIYMIARIVVFKDAALGVARPDLAVRLPDGTLFHDREGLTWTDPWQAEVRAYNIAIAIEIKKKTS